MAGIRRALKTAPCAADSCTAYPKAPQICGGKGGFANRLTLKQTTRELGELPLERLKYGSTFVHVTPDAIASKARADWLTNEIAPNENDDIVWRFLVVGRLPIVHFLSHSSASVLSVMTVARHGARFAAPLPGSPMAFQCRLAPQERRLQNAGGRAFLRIWQIAARTAARSGFSSFMLLLILVLSV